MIWQITQLTNEKCNIIKFKNHMTQLFEIQSNGKTDTESNV